MLFQFVTSVVTSKPLCCGNSCMCAMCLLCSVAKTQSVSLSYFLEISDVLMALMNIFISNNAMMMLIQVRMMMMMMMLFCVELSQLCSRMKYWTCFLTTGLL